MAAVTIFNDSWEGMYLGMNTHCYVCAKETMFILQNAKDPTCIFTVSIC